jgi:rhodanese-related sulfurtransferase
MFGWLRKAKQTTLALSPEEAKVEVAAGRAVLIDVREDAEWRAGHVPGALHVALTRFAKEAGRIPPDKRAILYCRTGFRSGQALKLCAKLGLPIDSHLSGGYDSWRRWYPH